MFQKINCLFNTGGYYDVLLKKSGSEIYYALCHNRCYKKIKAKLRLKGIISRNKALENSFTYARKKLKRVSEMKKIVFIIKDFFNAGLERRVTNLSNELANGGCSVIILATHGVAESTIFRLHPNVSVVMVDEGKKTFTEKTPKLKDDAETIEKEKPQTITPAAVHSGGKSKGGLKKSLKERGYELVCSNNLFRSVYYKKLSKSVYRDWFLKQKPDVVVAFGLSRFQKAVFATRGMGIKVFDAELLTLKKSISQDKKTYSYYSGLLKKSNGIIVQTKEEGEYFGKEKDIKIHVINNPVKPGLPEAYRGKRDEVIVNYCRMTPQKNIELLIDAFEKLHGEYPRYRLEVYGNAQDNEEREYKNRILRLVGERNLDDCVSVYPPAADVHKKVLKSAMFVSSSDYEGLSNSMLESMAIGLPCICTDCLGGGTREVMTDHENGLIVPMNDAEAMYRAMKEFIENPALAQKCSQNAMKIREKLSVEKITRQWLDVIENN